MKNRSTIGYLKILLLLILMITQIYGACIEEERAALLEIKASVKSHCADADDLLPTWTDHGGRECCHWERVTCNSTTGRITDLTLDHLFEIVYEDFSQKYWELNISLFLHFQELTNLNLAYDLLDNGIEKTGTISFFTQF